MIKFIGTKDGAPLYGFGLSAENMRLLLEGRPISVDLSKMCRGHRGTVLIIGGETEQSMFDELQKMGMLPPVAAIRPNQVDHEQT